MVIPSTATPCLYLAHNIGLGYIPIKPDTMTSPVYFCTSTLPLHKPLLRSGYLIVGELLWDGSTAAGTILHTLSSSFSLAAMINCQELPGLLSSGELGLSTKEGLGP